MENARYNTLQRLLNEQKCFKVIAGAGNEDEDQVKKIAFIYTLAGAKLIDVSANIKVIKSASEGVELAFKLSKKLDIKLKTKPFIVTSVGMPGDHHVRKSYIDPSTCIACNLCIPVCPTNAIPKNFTDNLREYISKGGSFETEDQQKEIVIKDLCIGCGKCSNICPKDNIISYRHNEKELNKLLPLCMDAGAESFELHAAVAEDDITKKEWILINDVNPHNYNSMCLDRLNLGNLNIEKRVGEAKKISKGKIIIQADGYPMSGGENDYNTTLQAIACADVLNKKFNMRKNVKEKKSGPGKASLSSKKIYRSLNHPLGIHILLSGGTNFLTKKLANIAGVRFSGIAIGTFARDIIENYIQDDNFYDKKKIIKNAYLTAKKLVNANIGKINE